MDELRKAAKRRERAEAAYREALLNAVSEHGYATVANTLGMSRQGVRELALRLTKES